MTKEQAIIKVEKLVNYYDSNIDTWENKNYKEAQAREDFLDAFFDAFGWVVSGIPEGLSPADRDVLVEYSLKDGTTKSLDYIFKIKNRHQFIVEAKKPSENIDNPKHIFQAKSYGFLSKIPFVILTNFKELRIYDISTKPNFNQLTEDLIFSCNYKEYIENIDFLWDNFSKESIINKSLISLYLERRKEQKVDINTVDYNYINKKGETLLDSIFLQDLENIRISIAQSIIDNTEKTLTDKEVNEITQRLLDLILFIRFLEDNEIEDIELLRKIISEENNYLEEILSLSKELNKKYNGLLFHEYKFLSEIKIDNNVLKDNILKVYYPESPYNFSKISIEILGQIFEQYLAKRLSNVSNTIELNIKPEVKKAGGIYFTPEYIVNKLLEDTLDQFLSDKEPTEEFLISKILDFSCGSGIFLIKAFKKIISYFEANYSLLPDNCFFTDSLGKIKLTMESKKKLLHNNIFGIDIDNQAIEITKMSLYFTMLENYSEDNSPRPLLPDLEKNIICGNSIVGTDFFEMFPDVETNTINAINPLSWKDEGLNKFNIIVGNPPYLRIQLLEELYPLEYEQYLKDKYSYAHSNFDLSILFIEKGFESLDSDGKMGFIIPNTVLRAKYGEIFRTYVSSNKNLSKLIHFNDFQVFQNSTTYTCLIFFDNESTSNEYFDFASIKKVENNILDQDIEYNQVEKSKLSREPWFFSASEVQSKFLETIYKNAFLLKDLENLTKIFVGLQPSINEVFLLKKIKETDNEIVCFSEALGKNHTFEKGLLKKMVKGSRNIFRYGIITENLLLFPYENNNKLNKSELITEKELKLNYPKTWKYFLKCKPILTQKDALKGKDFYKYIYKKNHNLFDNKKILLPSLCYGSRFALDNNGEYYFTGSGEGGGGGYALLLNNTKSYYNYFNILGILNSKLISALIEIIGKNKRGGYKGIDRTFIHNIPLITPESKQKQTILNQIGVKTKRINSLYAGQITIPIKRLIKQLENQINQLTLELYDITDVELLNFINDLND